MNNKKTQEQTAKEEPPKLVQAKKLTREEALLQWDLFIEPHQNHDTSTSFGVFFSFFVVPTCLILYFIYQLQTNLAITKVKSDSVGLRYGDVIHLNIQCTSTTGCFVISFDEKSNPVPISMNYNQNIIFNFTYQKIGQIATIFDKGFTRGIPYILPDPNSNGTRIGTCVRIGNPYGAHFSLTNSDGTKTSLSKNSTLVTAEPTFGITNVITIDRDTKYTKGQNKLLYTVKGLDPSHTGNKANIFANTSTDSPFLGDLYTLYTSYGRVDIAQFMQWAGYTQSTFDTDYSNGNWWENCYYKDTATTSCAATENCLLMAGIGIYVDPAVMTTKISYLDMFFVVTTSITATGGAMGLVMAAISNFLKIYRIFYMPQTLLPIDASMTVPTDKIEILRSNDKLNLSDPKRKEDVLKTKDMDMKPEDV